MSRFPNLGVLPVTNHYINVTFYIKEKSAENVAEIPIIKTYLLLQHLHSNLTASQQQHSSKESKLMNELIECLKVFV